MSVSVITKNNKNVLLIDYSDCSSTEEMIRNLEEAAERIKAPDVDMTLSDTRQVKFSAEFTESVKNKVVDVFSKHTSKNAIVGVSGLQKVIVRGMNFHSKSTKSMVPFTTREEALDYLTGQVS